MSGHQVQACLWGAKTIGISIFLEHSTTACMGQQDDGVMHIFLHSTTAAATRRWGYGYFLHSTTAWGNKTMGLWIFLCTPPLQLPQDDRDIDIFCTPPLQMQQDMIGIWIFFALHHCMHALLQQDDMLWIFFRSTTAAATRR